MWSDRDPSVPDLAPQEVGEGTEREISDRPAIRKEQPLERKVPAVQLLANVAHEDDHVERLKTEIGHKERVLTDAIGAISAPILDHRRD